MAGIICAIRGGPSSQPTISTSIRLAQDTGEKIHFLYIVNLDFLTLSNSSKTNHIAQEMGEMGEFILLSAQEQANSFGVSSEALVRDGKVADEIIAYCEEMNPSYVVLGHPLEDQIENNLFSRQLINTVADRIKGVCQASIVFPEPLSKYSADSR